MNNRYAMDEMADRLNLEFQRLKVEGDRLVIILLIVRRCHHMGANPGPRVS